MELAERRRSKSLATGTGEVGSPSGGLAASESGQVGETRRMQPSGGLSGALHGKDEGPAVTGWAFQRGWLDPQSSGKLERWIRPATPGHCLRTSAGDH